MRQHRAQGGQVSWGKTAAARRRQEVTKGCSLQSSSDHGGYWKGTPTTRGRQQIVPRVGVGTTGLVEARSPTANLSWGRTQPCRTGRVTCAVTCYTVGTSLTAEYETRV